MKNRTFKFKVGDYVRILKDGNGNPSHVGTVQRIMYIAPASRYPYRVGDKRLMFTEDELELDISYVVRNFYS